MGKELYNTFDFVINEDGDIMLLLFMSEGRPEFPRFEVEKETNTLWLYRSVEKVLGLYDIEPKIIAKLAAMKKLLVCEMTMPPAEANSEIAYVYEAMTL